MQLYNESSQRIDKSVPLEEINKGVNTSCSVESR